MRSTSENSDVSTHEMKYIWYLLKKDNFLFIYTFSLATPNVSLGKRKNSLISFDISDDLHKTSRPVCLKMDHMKYQGLIWFIKEAF